MVTNTQPATFAALLRRYRRAAGLTQEALAERAHMSVRGVSNLERGVRRLPQRGTVDLLADALALSREERAAFLALARPRSVPALAPPPAGFRTSDMPLPPTPLVGRADEVATAAALLGRKEVRLLTMTGPGGVGKTRLALAVAEALQASFPDGVAFVALAALRDADLLAATVASTLGLSDAGRRPVWESLTDYLRSREMLLLLDNYEHLLAAAPVVSDLLAVCPRLKVLVTSRAALHLRGEQEVPVAPLALPDLALNPELDALAASAAVILFVHRARAVQLDFALTPANTRAVATICRRLDGLPLAIELAAARVKVLTPHMLLDRLTHRLDVLSDGAADAPARQRTLRATLTWSYDLLSAQEQALFRRLCVFSGGWTLQAAETVCSAPHPLAGAAGRSPAAAEALSPHNGLPDNRAPVLAWLAALVDRSLVQRMEAPDGDLRFILLETVREFGLERLAASGEEEALRRQHALTFQDLAEAAAEELTGPQQAEWMRRLEREHDNIRAALQWTWERDEAELALRLVSALGRFWWLRGHVGEGRRWLEGVLARYPAVQSTVRVRALHGAGLLAESQTDYASATALYEEGLSLSRHLGDTAQAGQILNKLGDIAFYKGDYAQATMLIEESLTVRRSLGQSLGIAAALSGLGDVATATGDYARARACYTESLALSRGLGNTQGVAVLLNNLGVVAESLDEQAGALALYEESLALRRQLGHPRGIASSLANLANLASRQGNPGRAGALYRESLALFRDMGDRACITVCLVGLATAAGAQGQHRQAVHLLAAADVVREDSGTVLPEAERAREDRLRVELRAALGADSYAAAWVAGQALSLEQATAVASAE